MTLDELPADQIFTMTIELERLFKFARCTPECHGCEHPINIGEDFQLLSMVFDKGTYYEDERDTMVCGTCDRAQLRARLEATDEERRQAREAPRGGYSRPALSATRLTVAHPLPAPRSR
jgi:hypothetical protein